MTVPAWQAGTLYSPGAVVKRNSATAVTAAPPANANFESGDSDWTKEASWEIGEYVAHFDGTWAARNRDTIGTARIYGAAASPAVAGMSVSASCKCRRGDNGMSGAVQLEWLDSGMVSLRIDTGNVIDSSTDKWKTSTVTGVAPSGTAFVRVGATCTQGHTGRNFYVDAFQWNYAYSAPLDALTFRAVQATPGYSGGVEPVWPTVLGDTVPDNEVTWEAIDSSTVTWEAAPILVSGATEPEFPDEVGATAPDNTIVWTAISRRVEDEKCPNGPIVLIGASKIFCADGDIIPFSATVNPLDWSTEDDAGYLPFGLQAYGDEPVAAMGLYRSNLTAFNGSGFQMWQIDPDPQNMALLDTAPVGCMDHKSVKPFQNDLIFRSPVGIRNISIAGASTNLQAGSTGDPIDVLVKAKIDAGEEVTASLFIPQFGQYWLAFGDEVFVLTINDSKKNRWSRYTFSEGITDLTLLDSDLYIRTDTDKVWKLTYDQVDDDVPVGVTATVVIELTSEGDTDGTYDYAGFEDGAYGSVSPTSITGAYAIKALFARGTAGSYFQSLVTFSLDDTAPSDAFDVIQFLDADGNTRVLLRSDAVDPAGVTESGVITWEWSVSVPSDPTPMIFEAGGEGAITYDVSIVSVIEEEGTVPFQGVIWWPYLDFGSLGVEKGFDSFDLVADAELGVSVSVGYDQRKRDWRTEDYLIDGDSLPGESIPLPVAGPSFDFRLTFEPSQYWEWNAAMIYVQDWR